MKEKGMIRSLAAPLAAYVALGASVCSAAEEGGGALAGMAKTIVIVAVVFFAVLAAIIIYSMKVRGQAIKREERDKILNSSLDDLAQKKFEAPSGGELPNKNPYSHRSE